MLKFFQFSGTISGTTLFLRVLFTILLSIPVMIIFFSFVADYLTSSGLIDMSNPNFDQSAFQESIEENPEEFMDAMLSSITSNWIIALTLSYIPAIWFSLASYYKRISALFYENRNNIFAIYVGFGLISNATAFGILPILSFLKTPFSLISLAILLFLIFKNSEIDKDDHEG
jgi:hypothetical protein|tara:strand:+ start:3835 stop:4350 length:516 start_codon:yes stop_codon:yes gene_type:complete